MKIILISPPFGEGGQKSKGLPIAPPVLEYLAGLTEQVRPGEHSLTLVDANLRSFDPATCDADLVGITVLTPQAPWAYRTADVLRARGIQVLLGGIHVHAVPDEAGVHADAIVLGEAETVWGDVLDDAVSRCLKPRYHGPYAPLENLPQPITNLLPDRYQFGSFFTSRGCPHSCAFCSVHEFFGRTVRVRPIDEVVAEMAASKKRLFWNIDDNVWGVNVGRSIDLYREMAHPVMTTPFPGTKLYEEYRPYLIPGQDWDLYDGNHANFYHDDPEMTPDAREGAIVKLRDDIFTIPQILHRMTKVGIKGFPMSHITSWAVQYPQGRAFHEFARERERTQAAKEVSA